jgi:HTH-type transcriptional regulator / antitoxin HigA
MTLTFNPQTYSHLLAEISPKVIETEAEYDQALAAGHISVKSSQEGA